MRKNIIILAMILFLVIAAMQAYAAQDFIIENKTSALFIVNGTTENNFLGGVG